MGAVGLQPLTTLELASAPSSQSHHYVPMRIRALFARVTPLCTVSVIIQPHETIATLFEMFRKELQSHRKHRVFTAAYSIVHTHKSGIQEEDDKVYAIVDGEPDVIAKYLIPGRSPGPEQDGSVLLWQWRPIGGGHGRAHATGRGTCIGEAA
jgi:hypothetical protein